MTEVSDPSAPSGSTVPTTSRSRAQSRDLSGAFVAVVGPSALLLAHTVMYGQWIEDDAGITFAYARSISEGFGPVLQPGSAPVEGWSNPTWLGVMVVGRWAGLFDHGTWFGLSDLVAFPKLVGFVCSVAMFAAMYAVARAASRRPVFTATLAGSATALVPSFVIWTTSGLENSLFALVVVTLAAVLVRARVDHKLLTTRTAVGCGLLASVAALTRPDGAIYVLAYPTVVLSLVGPLRSLATWRSIGHSLGAFSVPVGLYGIWRLIIFEDWLPTTARAKGQGLPGLDSFNRPGELALYAGWLAFALVSVAVVMTLRREGDARRAVATLMVPLALGVLAYVVLAPDWMAQYRFATPIWPLSALVAVLAVEQMAEQVRSGRRRGLMAGIAVVVLASLAGFVNDLTTFRDNTTAPMCFVAQSVGQRVDAYADILGIRSGSLLAVDGGGTSLVSRMRFVDLSGLTDATIARAWQNGDIAGLREYVFAEVRPTFIKSSVAWGGAAVTNLLRDSRFDRNYVLLFSPEAGSGTWVRRDAVGDLSRVQVVRTWAPQAYAAVEQRYLQAEARTQWRCGPGLTPSDPSPFPLPGGT